MLKKVCKKKKKTVEKKTKRHYQENFVYKEYARKKKCMKKI